MPAHRTRNISRPFVRPYAQATAGQGIVEYGGALVLAAILVALSIFIVPEEVAALIQHLYHLAIQSFSRAIPAP